MNTEMIISTLETMGFEVTELGYNCYGFIFDCKSYIYMTDDNDENFLRIARYDLYEITEENRLDVLNAMQEASYNIKYGKMVIVNDNSVWAVYEHYLLPSDNLVMLLEHIILSLQTMVMVFLCSVNGGDIQEHFELQDLDGSSSDEDNGQAAELDDDETDNLLELFLKRLKEAEIEEVETDTDDKEE